MAAHAPEGRPSASLSLTWEAVWARRLARHALLERAPAARLAEVAGIVCGIHAQMLPAAELSLGTRVAGVTRQDVRAALWETRTLVKTYGIRGTIHLFPAAELPLWLAALRRRIDAREEKRLAQMGLSLSRLTTIVEAIGRALDGQQLTTRQLGEEIARLAGSWVLEETIPAFGGAWPRWRLTLGWAAVAGQLCFGPNVGSAVTFVRPDQWLGSWQAVDPQAALTAVYRRFLRAYGPATYREFAQWFSQPLITTRALEATLRPELVEVDVEGWSAVLLAADAQETSPSAADSVHLLPHFDCYLRGSFPRERLTAGWATRAAGGTGNVPTLLVGGTVAGVWEARRKGRRLELRVEPFQELTARQHANLEVAAARIGAFEEAEVTLALGAVAVRPHL